MFWVIMFYVFNGIALLFLIFNFATREIHQKEVDDDERLCKELMEAGIKNDSTVGLENKYLVEKK